MITHQPQPMPEPATEVSFTEMNDAARSLAVTPEQERTIKNVALVGATAAINPAQVVASIEEIPEEVRKNMTNYETQELDTRMMKILFAKNDWVRVDDIVFLLYRSWLVVCDRMRIIRRLNALADEGRVEKREGKRGLYRLSADARADFRVGG